MGVHQRVGNAYAGGSVGQRCSHGTRSSLWPAGRYIQHTYDCTLHCAGFIPYTKLDPARLRAGPVGDVSFLVGQVVRAKVITVRCAHARMPDACASHPHADARHSHHLQLLACKVSLPWSATATETPHASQARGTCPCTCP